MPSLPILEQTPVPSSPSSSSSSAIQPPPPPTLTRKRKRRNSTMIIKPARWSPPLHRHRQHPSNAFMTAAPIETDFQPTFYNPNEIKHRRRISSQQYGILEDEYQINTKPNASKRHYLAELLGMTPRTVQIWFQNKRAKAKHHQGKPLHAETKSPTVSTIKSLAVATKSTQSSASQSSSTTNSTAVTGPVDQVVFDDGRLDPIYLMDDYDMATFMAAASSSPSLSSTSTPSMTQYGTDQQQQPLGDHHDGNDNVTVVVERMDGNFGQQPCMADDHGTTTSVSTSISAPTTLSTPSSSSSSSVSSSPLLASSGTNDSFSMGLHYYSTTTNQHQRQHQGYDETRLSSSTASSSLCQPFSPLNSSPSSELYSMMKEHHDDQTQELRHDSLYILNWMQKTPPTNLPQMDATVVPTWPYVMDQSDLQNDGFDFNFDHDDWMGPFYVSA